MCDQRTITGPLKHARLDLELAQHAASQQVGGAAMHVFVFVDCTVCAVSVLQADVTPPLPVR